MSNNHKNIIPVPAELIATFEIVQEIGGSFVEQGENIRGWAQFGKVGITESRACLISIIKTAERAIVVLDKLSTFFVRE